MRTPGIERPLFAAAVLAILSTGASAQTASAYNDVVVPADAQATRMLKAFKAWVGRWNVPNASVAIMRDNTLIGSYGTGTHTPTTPVPFASESKAITAICIARLVEANQLAFTDKLRQLLPAYFVAHPPKDRRAEAITISELLTHTSGLTYDPSQGSDGAEIEQLPLDQENLDKQATITLRKDLGDSLGASYFYNNMNYALLGLVIETLTGEDYETYCFDHVLSPVGITDAKLNPKWRVMSSWGGWKMSAVDYTRFLSYYVPSITMLTVPLSQWPKFVVGGGAYYSLGSFMRNAGGGAHNFWHSGSWSWSNPPKSSFGGYFAVYGENVRYMANYEPTQSDSAVSDLDSAMSTAALGAARATPQLEPQHITH